VMDDVLLNQWGTLAGATAIDCTTPTVEMLQVLPQEAKSPRERSNDFADFAPPRD
jgi:hypothetical protein